MLDDARGGAGIEARHVAQQVLARGVEFHAHVVHAGDDDVVEGTLERVLVDVVLVLTDADRLRVDLHQLRQRVHETATDGDRAAHGDVVIREFLTGNLRGRVNRRAGFVDHDDRDGSRQLDLADKSLVSRDAVPLPMAMASM